MVCSAYIAPDGLTGARRVGPVVCHVPARRHGAFQGRPFAGGAGTHVGCISWLARRQTAFVLGKFDFCVEEKQGMISRENRVHARDYANVS